MLTDLIAWVLTETDLNPDKGVISSAKEFCSDNNIEYDATIIEPALFDALLTTKEKDK